MGVSVGVCMCVCVSDVLGASLLQLIVQMDDLYRGVYLFCGEGTSGDLLFPGVAEFFTLLHIPGTIFHPHTHNPQTDLFTGSLPVHIHPPQHMHTYCYTHTHTHILLHICYKHQTYSSTGNHKHTLSDIKCMSTHDTLFLFSSSFVLFFYCLQQYSYCEL